MKVVNRRNFIKGAGATGLMLYASPQMFAGTQKPAKKLIWVLLRGAMDGIHGVVPIGDPHLMTHRAALITPMQKSLLPLNPQFALHPSLVQMHKMFTDGELSPVVATASNYRERSHFDGQDALESGLDDVDYNNGWMGRLSKEVNGEGLSISRNVPISFRGAELPTSWYPNRLKASNEDTLARLQDLYDEHPKMQMWLNQAISTQDMLGSMSKPKGARPNFVALSRQCGEIMKQNDNIAIGMLDMGGWDTHNAQANRLQRQFDLLDKGLHSLQQTLGSVWQDTVVVVNTEFGRTVKINGTKGTDHGTASSMFLAGGALRGGAVLGHWPGLAPSALYQQRDLMPTSDVRSWIATLLHQHFSLSLQRIDRVFPNVSLMKTRLVK